MILETFFDDNRLHLTEKSLRPIACGQPFILAGTYGSLEYLRSYGFKTFENIWDERYDEVKDAHDRLLCIADLMKQIANWAPDTRINKIKQAQVIAEYNRKHFFSQEFFKIVTGELKTNLKLAFKKFCLDNNYHAWLDQWNNRLLHQPVVDYLTANQDCMYTNMTQIDFIKKIIHDKLTKCSISNKP